MTKELVTHEHEREIMIREAYQLGINFFDIYDNNWEVYQFEPMSRHMEPFIKEAVISIHLNPYEGRTAEREVERALRLFRRDNLDMVRVYAQTSKDAHWKHWEEAFRMKEKGMIRAVGMPIHYAKDIETVIRTFPLDFVILPYNFYHNLLYTGKPAGDMHPLGKALRAKGIGIVTMKPFGTDWFVDPLISAAKELDPEISLPQAALRYIFNSPLQPDAILGGMYNLDHVYENIAACYSPRISTREEALLGKLRKVAKVHETAWLPDHYHFLARWAPEPSVEMS